MKSEFLHRDLKKIFPWVSPRTIIYWAERGLVTPSVDASGRGSARKYSYSNLIEIAVINELLGWNISFSKIKFILSNDLYRNIINDQKWDNIFWVSRQTVPVSSPKAKGASWVGDAGRAPLLDLIKDSGLKHFKKMGTSDIIINFDLINKYIKKQIERVLE